MSNRPPGPGTSDQRETRVKRALTNPIYFGEAYYAPFDPNWTESLPPFAHDMMRFVVGARPWPKVAGVIMLPPEFLKTTLISQVYPLWLTVRARFYGELLRGLLLSEEEGMAKGNLAVIKWHIENNERLASDFSDAKGNRILIPDPNTEMWREDSIVVHRPDIVSRDPTWQAKGLDSKGIQGRRLDVVIGDDIVTPQNADSPAKRKSALKIMDMSVETRVIAGGQILVAGNFNDPKDLLFTFSSRKRYLEFRRPSLHRPDDPSKAPAESNLFDPEHSYATWPNNWTYERLKIEYEEKPNRFRRIHLLDPRAEQGDRLQISWVTLLTEDHGAPLLAQASFFFGVDPAPGGESDDLDFFNITVLAVTNSHADLVQSFNVRADTTRQVDLLGRIYDTYSRIGYGVKAIGGAKHTLDSYFRGAVVIKRPDLKGKLEDVSIPRSEQGKLERLEGLGPQAHSGWLRVWESAWSTRTADLLDQHEELTLMEEWREFPYGNHDDRLDGLDIALRVAEMYGHMGTRTFKLAVAEA